MNKCFELANMLNDGMGKIEEYVKKIIDIKDGNWINLYNNNNEVVYSFRVNKSKLVTTIIQCDDNFVTYAEVCEGNVVGCINLAYKEVDIVKFIKTENGDYKEEYGGTLYSFEDVANLKFNTTNSINVLKDIHESAETFYLSVITLNNDEELSFPDEKLVCKLNRIHMVENGDTITYKGIVYQDDCTSRKEWERLKEPYPIRTHLKKRRGKLFIMMNTLRD